MGYAVERINVKGVLFKPPTRRRTMNSILAAGAQPPAPATTQGTKRKADDHPAYSYTTSSTTTKLAPNRAAPATTTSAAPEPPTKKARVDPPAAPRAPRVEPIKDFEAHIKSLKPWTPPPKAKKSKGSAMDKIRAVGPSPSYRYGIWRTEGYEQSQQARAEEQGKGKEEVKKVEKKIVPASNDFFEQFKPSKTA